MVPEGPPFTLQQNGTDQGMEMKGLWLALSKGKAGGKVGVWMSGMPPDTR